MKAEDIEKIQDKYLKQALDVNDEEYENIEEILLHMKSSSMASAFMQPYHKGPEEKCPGCNVYKGQRHGEECKFR